MKAYFLKSFDLVATALTVYGIETLTLCLHYSEDGHQLQQRLPFTVLKLNDRLAVKITQLQQRLPFTVLKLVCHTIV